MSERYLHGVFAEAPLVHPFRSPTNHAQRLRALRFAREKQSRLLWIVAYDKVVSKDELVSAVVIVVVVDEEEEEDEDED